MKSDIEHWQTLSDRHPAEWAPLWPMLEVEHLRPSFPSDVVCMGNPNDPNRAPLFVWANRVHPDFTQSIPRSAIMVIAHLLDVSPLLTDGRGAEGRVLWDRLHGPVYRPLLAYAWNKTAHAYGYEVDEDELIDAQWRRVLSLVASSEFDADVLHAPVRRAEIERQGGVYAE